LSSVSELVWQILSLAPLREPGRLRGLGEALDSEPDFKFTHYGRGDSASRRLKDTVAGLFADHASKLVPNQPEIWFLARRESPAISLDIYLADDGRLLRGIPHSFNAGITDTSWFDSPERLRKLSDYLTRVADSAGAFYGYCALGEMLDQRRQLLERHAGPILGGLFKAGRVAEDLQRELPDVYWWNYYGPAMVEKWGGRLDGLGARQTRTPAGANVVIATDVPFIHDPKIKRVDGYKWKLPFYAALGADTFMHEGQEQRGVGELVPDFDSHRRAAGFKAAPIPDVDESFELRLAYAAGASSIAEISRLLSRHEQITAPARLESGAAIVYRNPETAVEASFELEASGLVFRLPLVKPTFFALETAPLVGELAEARLTAESPDPSRLTSQWEAANAVAIRRLNTALPPRMSRDRSDRWWRYMRKKKDLHAQLGDDVFVPRIVAVAPGRRATDLQLHITWTDGIPLVLPECDLVTLLDGKRPSEFKIRGTAAYSDLLSALRPYLDTIEVEGLGSVPLLKPERAKAARSVFVELPTRAVDHVEVEPAAWIDAE
jgi:hypothetical protein